MGWGDAAVGAGTGALSGSAFGPVGSLIGAGIGLFGSLFGAHEQSSAASNAAAQQSAAAKYAADLQDAAARRSEAFLRQQAESEWRNQESTRAQNYGQYVAQRHGWGTFGQMLGLPAPEIPDYVASQDPGYDGSSAPSGGAPASGAVPGTPSDLATALDQANKIAYGGQAKHTDPAYWQALWAKDPDYAWKRMLGWQAGGADAATSGPYAGTSAAAAPHVAAAAPNGTLAPMIQPYRVLSPTAALNPYGTA